MTTAEALAAARKLIDTPEKWWQCNITQAIRKVCGTHTKAESAARHTLVQAMGESCPSIASVERYRTRNHADVMAMFDRAIAAAKEGA